MYANGVRHFIDTQDFTKEELLDIIHLSLEIKKSIKAGYNPAASERKNAWNDLPAVLYKNPCFF